MHQPRTLDRLRRHYEIEKELALQLKSASREERKVLYRRLYDELFRRVPDHPGLTRRFSAEQQAREIALQLCYIERFLGPDKSYLEIGAGDCALALQVCERARKVVAVDVSRLIGEAVTLPDNFELIISDGCSIPIEPGCIDVAFSNQLMEHLHPEDARAQLEGIFTALAPGGAYICITPNHLSGPHDVSSHFSGEAEGFHLKEYSIRELCRLFRNVGFARLRLLVGGKGRFLLFPVPPAATIEAALGSIPSRRLQRAVAATAPARALLGVRLVGYKPARVQKGRRGVDG
jgi:SAM-dependent methyltransferase